MTEPHLCRALGTHVWKLVGPIVVLPNNTRRVALHCTRCATWRYDCWSRRTGGLESGRTYERPDDYKDYVKSHDRDAARLDIMGESKETKDEAEHPRLRLVQGRARGGRKPPAGRRARAG